MNEAHWKRLSPLLDELFVLDADARAARLAAIAQDDAALAAELQHLLTVDEQSGLLDAGVANAAATVMSQLTAMDPRPAQASPSSGLRIGHYRLIERLGTGGMGDVWRAERVDDFEQAVAVKLIRPLLDSPALRERFARERRILARLDHPGIARLLDGGVSDDGTPWYAMEYVPGTDIISFANEKKLSTRERVELLLQVCEAVAHAQTQLIVHRDIKPSNLLVDAKGRTRVLDFGIARLLDDSGAQALTGTGVRVFSPAYAAPEQIRGEPVDTAADVFALGAVLYELLVGTPPHPQRSAAPELLIANLANETAPHPGRALRNKSRSTGSAHTTTSSKDISNDLDTLVAKALQPEPARRYAGAAQLAEDLKRWLDGRPISAQPDTATYRMKKFVARHRLAVGSASAVLLALIGGLGLALWQAKVAREHAQRAEQQAELAREQTARTRKVKEFLVSVFLPADPLRRDGDAPRSIEEAFDAALERARSELSSDPVLQADVLDDFGEIRANQGRLDEARPLFEQALAVTEKEYGPDHPIAAESLVNLSVIAFLTSHTEEAARHIERAVAILERNDGGDPLALPSALLNLVSVRRQQGDHEAMRQANDRTLRLFRERAPDDARMIPVLSNAAMIALDSGAHDEAEALLNEVIPFIEHKYGPESPTLWSALSSLSNLAYIRGNTREELALTERALAVARAGFSGDHSWIANSLADLGLQRARMGESEKGEALLRESIAMYERLENIGAIASLRYLAIAQRQRDDDAGALASLARAGTLCAQADEGHSTLCAAVRANRAMLLARTGQGATALEEVEAAARLLPGSPNLYSEHAQVMEARAAALAALGRRDEALAEQDAAIALLRQNFGPAHPETQRVTQARTALQRLADKSAH